MVAIAKTEGRTNPQHGDIALVSKMGDLKGRTVERIAIQNPAALDSKIQEEKTLANTANFQRIASGVAVGVAAASTIVTCVLFPPVVAGLACLTVGTGALTGFLVDKRKRITNQVAVLEECQKALKTEEFQRYLETTFQTKEFAIPDLVKAHRLFTQNHRLTAADTALRQEEQTLKVHL